MGSSYHGLFVLSLLLLLLGGCEGARWAKSTKRWSKRWCTWGMWVGTSSVAMEIPCRQLIAQSSTGDSTIHDLRGPQQQQEPGFQCEKAAKGGLDLMPWLRGRKKRGGWNESRSGGFRPLTAGFCRRTGQHRHLPAAFETACGPLGPEDVSRWKI